MNDNKNNRVIRAHVLKARTLSPAGFYFPWVASPAKYSSPGRIPGSSNRPMTVSEKRCRGGVLCSRTRPVNFAVESPISVGSGRYFFKWTAISKRQEGGSGKGTQLPLITAQQPSLPQNACSVGEAPAAAASPPGARAAPALFGAPTFAGNPPSPAVPLRLRRGRRALSPAASRSGARSPTFPRVQPVTRSPISWWILLKRQRSRSRTKAIVLFPPLDSASLPECPFIYDYSHCLCVRAGGEPLCSSVYLRDGAGEGGRRFIKTCLVVSGAPA